MRKYKLDIYRKSDTWFAVIQDILVVGKGADPGSAAANAVAQADETLGRLQAAGALSTVPDGKFWKVGRFAAFARNVLFENAVRALVLFVFLGGLLLLVRHDVLAEVRHFRNDLMAEISVLRDVADASALDDKARVERLRERARKINDRLLPVAEELRPLFQALTGPKPEQGR